MFLGPFGKYDRMMLPEGWQGDGVIARVTAQERFRVTYHPNHVGRILHDLGFSPC